MSRFRMTQQMTRQFFLARKEANKCGLDLRLATTDAEARRVGGRYFFRERGGTEILAAFDDLDEVTELMASEAA